MWGRLLVVMLSAAVIGGCAEPPQPARPGTAIDPKTFKADPCYAYSTGALRSVLAGELARQHWPAMVGTPPQSRISANVTRCTWRYGPKDTKTNGDQSLGVFVYNELNNGAKLMSACKQRPLANAPAVRIGDESCVDDTGQVRLRVRDHYVSVWMEIPPRRLAGERQLTKTDTASFIASSEPAARAGLALPLAQDLAHRLH
jgi:hypothetical protein